MKITTLQFHSTREHGHGVVAVHFRSRRPVRFRAGQHGLWQIPGGGVHPFSIASAPEEDLLTLGTDLSSQSSLKRAIGGLTLGSRVRLLGPIGSFAPDPAAPSVVMLAQGIGITPFRSLLRHLAVSSPATPTTLLHVGAGAPFRDDTEPLATASTYLRSREQYADQLAVTVAHQPAACYLVSGSPAFVSSTATTLRQHGVPRHQIRRDAFWGYSGRDQTALTSQPA